MNLQISARGVITTLLIIICSLAIINSIQAYLDFIGIIKYIDWLDMDVEGNLPTFYSAIVIETCALLLFFIYLYHRKTGDAHAKAWLGLTVIFLFLGIDEATRLHEHSGRLLASLVNYEGETEIPWMIPYGLLFAFVAYKYIPWLKRLPEISRNRFVICAVVFLSGALGFEILGGTITPETGSDSGLYLILFTLEETLEMIGMALFARALILYISELPEKVSIQFSAGNDK